MSSLRSLLGRIAAPSARRFPLRSAEHDAKARTLSVLNGVPEDIIENRKVTIFKPSRSTTQSGNRNTKTWRLEFDRVPEEKFNSPLMGWTGSDDPTHCVSLNFPTLEEAVSYAEKNAWLYRVDDSAATEIPAKDKNYGDNFKYKPPRDETF